MKGKLKMKKIIMGMIAAVAMICGICGCDWNETTMTTTAQTAGNLTMLTWFSIDNPDAQVKEVLKDVVLAVTSTTVKVEEGATYMEAILPFVQSVALKQEKLNDYQKTLINAGAVVILNGIDTFLATNEKVKTDATLVNKVVGAFGNGCLAILNMSEDAPEIQRARGVYATRSLKCRDGKFLATPRSPDGKCKCECECCKSGCKCK